MRTDAWEAVVRTVRAASLQERCSHPADISTILQSLLNCSLAEQHIATPLPGFRMSRLLWASSMPADMRHRECGCQYALQSMRMCMSMSVSLCQPVSHTSGLWKVLPAWTKSSLNPPNNNGEPCSLIEEAHLQRQGLRLCLRPA